MRAVSDAYLRTILGAHTPIFRATVCAYFQTGTTPVGTRVSILDGAVELDGSADVWATASLTVPGAAAWPRRADDLYAPYGNEVYLERGVRYSDKLAEWVGLGYFRINKPEQPITPNGPITLTMSDRMNQIIRARLVQPIQFAAGTTLGTVVSTLVRDVYPDAVIEWDDNTDLDTLDRAAVVEEDRFAFLKDLISSRSKIGNFDHRGVLSIRSIPSADVPVWSVESGPYGAMVELSRSLSDEGVYNAVVARGDAVDESDTGTGATPYGLAFDSNPASPTYYYGRFGKVPRFFSSSFLTDDNMATAAAASLLRKAMGLPYNVNLNAAPNAALVPWDPIQTRAGDVEGVELHVIEKLTIPLTPNETIRATTREQTTILIGSA